MTNIQDLGIGGASHQQSTCICSRQHDINQNILNQRDCSDKDRVIANNPPRTGEQNNMAEYPTGSSSDF